MTITTLEALRDAIRESKGPDRELDAAFARLVLGWPDYRMHLTGAFRTKLPPGEQFYTPPLPEFTSPLAGPGALFAAARERWPECIISGGASEKLADAGFSLSPGYVPTCRSHPLLTHALALAMTEAAIQERDAG